jgi:hypothetical protein
MGRVPHANADPAPGPRLPCSSHILRSRRAFGFGRSDRALTSTEVAAPERIVANSIASSAAWARAKRWSADRGCRAALRGHCLRKRVAEHFSVSSLTTVTSTSRLVSATLTRVALERPRLRIGRCVASLQLSSSARCGRLTQRQGVPLGRSQELERYLLGGGPGVDAELGTGDVSPLSDTRKMTASLMSSGSAHAMGMALIPLKASATSGGTFSAP